MSEDLDRRRERNRAAQARYRAAHHDEIVQKRRDDRATNPDKYRQQNRDLYWTNPDKFRTRGRQQMRDARARDPIKARAKDKAYHEAHRDHINQQGRERYRTDPERFSGGEQGRARRRENARKWWAANPELSRARHRAAYQANPEKARAATAKWRLAHLGKRTAYKRAYNAAHRTETCARQRDWFARHPEKYSEYNRKHGHKRRALLRGGPIEPIDFQAIYERDRGRCHICGKRVSSKTVSLDHLVPVIHGGPHLMTNLRLAHRSCNSSRKHRGPAQLLLL